MSKPIGVIGLAGHGKDTLADVLVSEFGYAKLSFAEPLKEFTASVCDFDDFEMNDRVAKESYRCRPWPFRTRSEFRALIPAALARLVNVDPACVERAVGGHFDDTVDTVASGLPVWNLYRQVSDRIAIYIEPLIFNGMHAEGRPTPRTIMQTLGTEVFRAIHPMFWTRIWTHRSQRNGGLVIAPDTRFMSETITVKGTGGTLVRVTAFVRNGVPDLKSAHPSERAMLMLPYDHEIKNDGSVEDFHEAVRAWARSFLLSVPEQQAPQPVPLSGSPR